MAIEIKYININKILEKKYDYNTSYQRGNLVWSLKIKNLFIDSVIKGFFIPPIIIANHEVVDGKQRLIALEDYKNNKWKWKPSDNVDAYFYKDLDWKTQTKFNNRKISLVDLGKIEKDKVLETFIRINEGSIKLNKAELRLAKTTPVNRELILKLAKTEIKQISNNKKNDKRFKIEELVMRCLTILNMPPMKKGVRQQMDSIFKSDLHDPELILKNSKKTISTMYSILNHDTIPIGSFNTIFESIFCAIYMHIESANSFKDNKKKIRDGINGKIQEINADQMGGGIKFDSMEFIRKRITKIEEILKPFYTDSRRLFSYDNKLTLWSTKEHICAKCGKKINDINDFEPDHVKAHTIGGKTSLDNARILCIECNRKEGIRIRDKSKNM